MSAVAPLAPFDWRNPDYIPIFHQRAAALARLRSDPVMLMMVRAHYREHIADFINDWGMTFDPRVAALKRNPIMPFVLFPKQRAFIDWMFDAWRNSTGGTCVKSRDAGISWLCMGFAVALCTLYDDVTVGFGSEKEDKVDRTGDPDCLFYKGRKFIEYLPPEFQGGYDEKSCSAHMRLWFPDTGSSITGEAGLNIGRGGRKSIYLVDEAAHVPNPKAIDESLVATTECRIDVSSVNGTANSFYERAHNGDVPRFDFDFKDDPRKDAEWERKKRATTDPAVFAKEYERNWAASIEGVVIPSAWVMAAVDAHKRLGLTPTGRKHGALDVADAGRDANAFGVAQSWLVESVQSWKGTADLDIFHSVERAFGLADMNGLDGFIYDADGLGAGVRGDARKVNAARTEAKAPTLQVTPFRGSGELFQPERIVEGTERKAEDFFENLKAQAWWTLRQRFQYTHRLMEAFNAGDHWEVDLSKFISIEGTFAERARLTIELSQPVWMLSKHGKWMVDKCPVGTKAEVRNAIKSPNLADTVMMLYAPRHVAMVIHPSLLSVPNVPRFR